MLRSPPPLCELLEESAAGAFELSPERDLQTLAALPGPRAPSEGQFWPAVDDVWGQLDPETLDSCANELFASGDILACCPEQAGPMLRRALQINTSEYSKMDSADPSSVQRGAARQPEPGLQEWQVRLLQREGQPASTLDQQQEARRSVAPSTLRAVDISPSQFQTSQGCSIVAALEAAADHQTYQQQPGASTMPRRGRAHIPHLAEDASAHFSLHLPVQASGWHGQQQQRDQHGALPPREHHRMPDQSQARPQTQQHALFGPPALGLRPEASAAKASVPVGQGHGWQAMQHNRHTQQDLDDPFGWHLTPEPGVPSHTLGTWPIPDAGGKQGSESLCPQPFMAADSPAGSFAVGLEPGSQRLASSNHQQEDMQLPRELLLPSPDHELLLPRGHDLHEQQQQQLPLVNGHVSPTEMASSEQLQRLQQHHTRSRPIMQVPEALRSQQTVPPASRARPVQQGPDLHDLSSTPWHQSHSQHAQQQPQQQLSQQQQHSLSAQQQGISAQRLGNLSTMQRPGDIASQQRQQQQQQHRSLSDLPALDKVTAGSQTHLLQQHASQIQASIYGQSADASRQQLRHASIGQPVLHGTWQGGLQQQPNSQPLAHMQLAIQRQQLQQLGAQPPRPASSAIEHQQWQQQKSHPHSQLLMSPADSISPRILSSGGPQLQGQQPIAAGSHSGSLSDERPPRDTLQDALHHLRAKQREAQQGRASQGREALTGSFDQSSIHSRQQATLAPLPGGFMLDQHLLGSGAAPPALQSVAGMRHNLPNGPMRSQPATARATGGLRWDSPPPTAAGSQAFSAPAPQSRHAAGALTIPSSTPSFAFPPGGLDIQRQLAVGEAMLKGALPFGVPKPLSAIMSGSMPVQTMSVLPAAEAMPHWPAPLQGNKLAQGGVIITEEDASQGSGAASGPPAGSVAPSTTPPVREATPTGTKPKRPRLDEAGPSSQEARKEQMTEEAAAAVIKALEPSLQRMQGQMEEVKMFKQVLGEREKCIKGLVGHMYDVQHKGDIPVEAREGAIFETVKAIQLLRQGPSKSKQLTIPLDPSGTWEEVAQSQAYSYHAFVYAWLTRRTDITIHVDLGPLQGKRTLQQLSELDPDAVNTLQLEYTNTLARLMREAKGNMMSAAGRQVARLSLQRQLVSMACESSLRKPHMGLGSAQLEALKRVVQRQQLPLHLVDEGLVNLQPQQMEQVLGMRDRYCANLERILQDRQHLLDFINQRLLNMQDPLPSTLVASADAEVAAFDAVTHLQENLTAHVDNFIEMLSYTQTIYTPFQAGAITALSQSIDDRAGDHLAFAEAFAVRHKRTPLIEQIKRFGKLFADTNPQRFTPEIAARRQPFNRSRVHLAPSHH